MNYPILEQKYGSEPVINPDHFGRERTRWQKLLPNRCLLTYQKEATDFLLQEHKTSVKRIAAKSLWGCKPYYTEHFCLAEIKGVGAPHAVLILEELIALGIREFLSIGIAGGLDQAGIFLCDKALRDDGTSQHYLPQSEYAFPDPALTERFAQALDSTGTAFRRAGTWTTAAFFRETQLEVETFAKQGLATVEMEAAALFTVAKFRKVAMAAAFVTSDLLKGEWVSLYTTQPDFVRGGLIKLAEAAELCFSRGG